ncbi:hypothetical protein WR25_13526 [Diploscapter pachys]|uniref:Uncharacterized protein n=1 Tax=Diploscapter pachys TaxID=2018661 RepID=A0A2A2KFP8_9BILA|nr:hypothetical protein WR25_13526 [Diploscapter pachys]
MDARRHPAFIQQQALQVVFVYIIALQREHCTAEGELGLVEEECRKRPQAWAVALGKPVATQIQTAQLGQTGQFCHVHRTERDVLIGESQHSQARQVLADRADTVEEGRGCRPQFEGPGDHQFLELRHLPQQALQQTLMLSPA